MKKIDKYLGPSLQPTLRQPSTSTILTTSAALPWSLTTKAELRRTLCILEKTEHSHPL